MKVIIFLLLITSCFISVYGQTDGTIVDSKVRQKMLEFHYKEAMQCFASEEYTKAIHHWEEILRIDPKQIQPPKLISLAREKIKSKHAGLLNEGKTAYTKGQYKLAVERLTEVLSYDPTDTKLRNLIAKLQKVSEIFGDETDSGKRSKLIRLSVSNYLTGKKIKTAVNAIIYSRQLSSKKEPHKKFYKLLEEEYPKTTNSVEVIPGMGFIEQKLVASLNYIYDAKYDRAIVECNEVLELDTRNIMAMKRMGSAYYALDKEKEAKKIWRKALKIYPKDKELKRFLKQ